MKFPGRFKDHFHTEKMHALSVSFVVNTMEETFGGTAGNIAYSLALLQASPAIIAAVGGDFAKYHEHFERLGISTAQTQLEPRVPTAVAHVITDDDDNQIAAFYPGALSKHYIGEIPQTTLAIVAAGNTTDMLEIPKVLRERGTPFFFDPGQMCTALSGADMRLAVRGATVLFGNDYEITMILKSTGWTMRELLKHVPTVVMTLGVKGTQILTEDKEIAVSAVEAIQVLDPTGAGDSYRAGFAMAWLRNLPVETCVKVASVVAVHAVEVYGTQKHVFTINGLRERYEKAYGDEFPL
jgi:adenosine kinase